MSDCEAAETGLTEKAVTADVKKRRPSRDPRFEKSEAVKKGKLSKSEQNLAEDSIAEAIETIKAYLFNCDLLDSKDPSESERYEQFGSFNEYVADLGLKDAVASRRSNALKIAKLKESLEFHLSEANLSQDEFLRNRMALHATRTSVSANEDRPGCEMKEVFVAIDVESLLKFNSLKGLEADSLDILVATSGAGRDLVARFVSSECPFKMAEADLERILKTLRTQIWDRACPGKYGCGKFSRNVLTASHRKESVEEAVKRLEEILKLRSVTELSLGFRWKNGVWKVGRMCDPGRFEKLCELATAKSRLCTVFIDNLPFKCSAKHIRELPELLTDKVHVAKISIPRFSVSKENKGFAFVEMGSEEEARAVICQLDSTWPQVWNDSDQSGTRLIRRNKRPLAVRSLARWQEVRKKSLDGDLAETRGVARPVAAQRCLAKFTGIEPSVTKLALCQFLEHVVKPRSVDYTFSSGTAVVELKAPEDLDLLLMDLRKTRRKLGGLDSYQVFPLSRETRDAAGRAEGDVPKFRMRCRKTLMNA